MLLFLLIITLIAVVVGTFLPAKPEVRSCTVTVALCSLYLGQVGFVGYNATVYMTNLWPAYTDGNSVWSLPSPCRGA